MEWFLKKFWKRLFVLSSSTICSQLLPQSKHQCKWNEPLNFKLRFKIYPSHQSLWKYNAIYFITFLKMKMNASKFIIILDTSWSSNILLKYLCHEGRCGMWEWEQEYGWHNRKNIKERTTWTSPHCSEGWLDITAITWVKGLHLSELREWRTWVYRMC